MKKDQRVELMQVSELCFVRYLHVNLPCRHDIVQLFDCSLGETGRILFFGCMLLVIQKNGIWDFSIVLLYLIVYGVWVG